MNPIASGGRYDGLLAHMGAAGLVPAVRVSRECSAHRAWWAIRMSAK